MPPNRGKPYQGYERKIKCNMQSKHKKMKALSIRQPWAWLIVNGYKDIENRTWKTDYRGKLLIHASKTFDHEVYEWVLNNFPEINLPGSKSKTIGAFLIGHYRTGGFVGTCRLNDVVTASESPFFTGPYGFKLRMVKPVEFVPYKGNLGLFNVPESILKSDLK